MSQRTLNIIAGIALPLLALALGMSGTALSAYGDRRARDAVVDQRIKKSEEAATAHARSAARIERTVTQMRVDQAQFMGGTHARIKTLERYHE